MRTFFTAKIAALLFFSFLIGLPVVGFAQTAEFQWVPTNDGIQVNADENEDGFLYDLQLYNQSDEIVIEQTNSTGNFFIENSEINRGEVYELFLTLNDEASGDFKTVHKEDVAVPRIIVDGKCEANLRNGNVVFTVNMTPDVGFFSNLSNPEVTPYESGSKRNAVSGLPYVHELAQPGWTYRFVISFAGSNITLDSGDVTELCEKEEEEDVRFSYEVSDDTVTAEVLTPLNDDYSYAWDVGGEAGPDYLGTSLSHTYPADGDASVRLVISQGDTVIGETSRSFVVPANFQDSDGDGTPDAEEGGEDMPDRDNDGIPDSEDDCPDDPTNTCENDDIGSGGFDGAPDSGLVNCTNNCGWVEFVEMINSLITWLIGFATVVATLLFMYAGFLYLTAGGNSDQAKQATGIFTNVAVGFGIILVAWLLVSAVVTLLTTDKWRDNNQDLLPIEFSYQIEDNTLQL